MTLQEIFNTLVDLNVQANYNLINCELIDYSTMYEISGEITYLCDEIANIVSLYKEFEPEVHACTLKKCSSIQLYQDIVEFMNYLTIWAETEGIKELVPLCIKMSQRVSIAIEDIVLMN